MCSPQRKSSSRYRCRTKRQLRRRRRSKNPLHNSSKICLPRPQNVSPSRKPPSPPFHKVKYIMAASSLSPPLPGEWGEGRAAISLNLPYKSGTVPTPLLKANGGRRFPLLNSPPPPLHGIAAPAGNPPSSLLRSAYLPPGRAEQGGEVRRQASGMVHERRDSSIRRFCLVSSKFNYVYQESFYTGPEVTKLANPTPGVGC